MHLCSSVYIALQCLSMQMGLLEDDLLDLISWCCSANGLQLCATVNDALTAYLKVNHFEALFKTWL